MPEAWRQAIESGIDADTAQQGLIPKTDSLVQFRAELGLISICWKDDGFRLTRIYIDRPGIEFYNSTP
ncbi:MAG: hypothetical protein ACUVV1_07270 [Fimbriimonadales bacterium]